jgi:hypothetical protein
MGFRQSSNPVAHSASCDVVAAAAHENAQLVVSGEVDGLYDVCCPVAAHDQAGATVYHSVPDGPYLVILCRAGGEEFAVKAV